MANASKSTKVPSMRDDTLYSDWKKELSIWEQTNIIRGVSKSVLAGELFESLHGTARSTVLSELTIAQIICDDGVKNISEKLDEFFIGDKVQNAFTANDDFMKFRRDPNMNLEQFLIEFKLRQNKVAAAGTTLSDGVLGYILLQCANLPSDKVEIVKATCTDLTYQNVKAQLSKIGLGKSLSSNHDTMKYSGPSTTKQHDFSQIKTEHTLYGQQYNTESSDDDHIDSYYSRRSFNNKQSFFPRQQNQNSLQSNSSGKHQRNPVDKFGNYLSCRYCSCTYHMLMDCMYAPDHVKQEWMNKRSQKSPYSNYSNNSKKPL